jgi:signal transduction histidine kinase/ActR/RegA family two-component response regulator
VCCALGAKGATVLAPKADDGTTALECIGQWGEQRDDAPASAARALDTCAPCWTPSTAALPLRIDGRAIAAAVFVLGAPASAEGRALVETMLDVCALSLDRARHLEGETEALGLLHATERGARHAAERLTVVLEAGEAIARASEPEEVIERLVRATVPRYADWCAVDLVDESGGIVLASVAHADPQKIAFARELRRRFPLVPETSAIHRVARSKKAELFGEVTDAMLEARIADPEELAMTRSIGIASVMIVPLIVHGHALGVLSMISSSAERRYDAVDLRLGEKLASRAALALHNAILIRQLRTRAEAEREAREAETNARRLKDEFLATVSHELRTPLNAILGWSTLLRSGRLAPETHERALATIERNARAQARLVDDILDVSRITSGKLAIRSDPLDAGAVLLLALEVVRPAALAKDIDVTTDADADLVVRGDADRLQQVYWNLLSNAVKFTPRGGSIEVAAKTVGPAVVVSVTDTGEGIRQDFLRHVFEPFRQADGTPTRAHGGLGLGLAIARHLVHLLGGEIAASSAGPGLGSTFTVSLPASTGAVNTRTSTRARPARLRDVDVLVVDDDADARDLASIVLSAEGARVRTAASAREALECIHQQTPDVLLCDIGMPEEDGLSLLPRARAAAGVPLPAIAYTAYADDASAEGAMHAGFDSQVTKPVDANTLVATVVRLVSRPAVSAAT